MQRTTDWFRGRALQPTATNPEGKPPVNPVREGWYEVCLHLQAFLNNNVCGRWYWHGMHWSDESGVVQTKGPWWWRGLTQEGWLNGCTRALEIPTKEPLPRWDVVMSRAEAEAVTLEFINSKPSNWETVAWLNDVCKNTHVVAKYASCFAFHNLLRKYAPLLRIITNWRTEDGA